MIKIYKNRSDAQYSRVTRWLEGFHLPYKVISQTGLLHEDLKHILHLTDGGFEEILVSKEKAPKIYEMVPENFYEMRVDEVIHYLLTHQKLLKSPLAFDENHLLVGYNSEKIRVFVPRVRGKLVGRMNKSS